MTTLTKNEKNMIFALAKGMSHVGDLIKVLIETTPDEQTRERLSEILKQSESRLEEFLNLVDAEWLPK